MTSACVLAPADAITLHGRQSDIVEIFVRALLRTNSAEVITRTLVDGHAAGPVQQLLVNAELESGRLVRILPDYEVKPTEAFLAYPSVRFMRPVVNVFSDFAIQEPHSVKGIAANAHWTEELSQQSVVRLLTSAAE